MPLAHSIEDLKILTYRLPNGERAVCEEALHEAAVARARGDKQVIQTRMEYVRGVLRNCKVLE